MHQKLRRAPCLSRQYPVGYFQANLHKEITRNKKSPGPKALTTHHNTIVFMNSCLAQFVFEILQRPPGRGPCRQYNHGVDLVSTSCLNIHSLSATFSHPPPPIAVSSILIMAPPPMFRGFRICLEVYLCSDQTLILGFDRRFPGRR